MSKKNWAQMDKRIRNRRAYWSKEDTESVNASLNKLPDLADAAERVEISQPALSSTQQDAQAEAAEG